MKYLYQNSKDKASENERIISRPVYFNRNENSKIINKNIHRDCSPVTGRAISEFQNNKFINFNFI
jgi:hypothetical protein